MGTTSYTQVAIWGPRTGSELDFEGDPDTAITEARATALRGLRGLRPRLPRARIAGCDIVSQTRTEDGRARPGYLVLLLIATPAAAVADIGGATLQNWVEAAVSVALLELINPVHVEWIRQAPVDSRR